MTTRPKYTSLPEAARALGVPYMRAYAWALSGKLAAERMAGHWLVDRRALEQLVKRQQNGDQSDRLP